MLNSLHRIRRLCWIVSTGSPAEAFAIRKCLHEQWQDLLLLACEKAFNEAVNAENTIHIPKLELHLKITSEQELMEVLPGLIQEQLKERLPSMNGITVPIIQPEVFWQETTAQQNQFATILHYLQTGSLPWQMSHASTGEIIVDLKEACRQLRSQILNYSYNQPQATAFYFRLLQLLPESESFVFVNALSERFSPEWRTAIAEFIQFVFDTRQSRLNQPTQWQLVAAIMSEGLNPSQPLPRPNFSTPDFRKIVDPVLSQAGIDRDAFFSSLPVAAALLFQPLTRSLRPPTLAIAPFVAEDQETMAVGNEVTRSPLNPDSNPDAIGQVENEDESSAEKAEAVLLQSNPALPSNSASTQSIAENPITAPTDNEATRSPLNPDSAGLFENEGEPLNQEDETDLPNLVLAPSEEIASTGVQFPLFVNHAGLVLLHPFLSPLFEATGIKATNSNAIAPSHLSRAAALLHFLATGQAEVYEFELGLIKVLLGLEPETPLLVGAGLIQERDREEAETVLQSTIRYWTILKNTSMDGLRTSFLQRPGLLRQTEKGWSLQVEHQSFDMLLEQLPWSISIIKLSWMRYPLYTEWQTF